MLALLFKFDLMCNIVVHGFTGMTRRCLDWVKSESQCSTWNDIACFHARTSWLLKNYKMVSRYASKTWEIIMTWCIFLFLFPQRGVLKILYNYIILIMSNNYGQSRSLYSVFKVSTLNQMKEVWEGIPLKLRSSLLMSCCVLWNLF